MPSEFLPHRTRDERPWGDFDQFTQNDPCTVKLLTVRLAKQFSLQRHTSRDEFWRILSGSGTITNGDAKTQGKAGDEYWIPRGNVHRAHADEKGDLHILEISFGAFDENDIERLEDDFGRAP